MISCNNTIGKIPATQLIRGWLCPGNVIPKNAVRDVNLRLGHANFMSGLPCFSSSLAGPRSIRIFIDLRRLPRPSCSSIVAGKTARPQPFGPWRDLLLLRNGNYTPLAFRTGFLSVTRVSGGKTDGYSIQASISAVLEPPSRQLNVLAELRLGWALRNPLCLVCM